MDNLNPAGEHICSRRVWKAIRINSALTNFFLVFLDKGFMACRSAANSEWLAVKKKKKSARTHQTVSVIPSFSELFISPPALRYSASAGHFLFLQVRETSPLRKASVQSSFFPPPLSSTTCQVSAPVGRSSNDCWHIYSHLSVRRLNISPTLSWTCVYFFLSVQMRFSLYLHGDFNGSLLVAIEENGTSTAPLVWERNSQGMDDWEDVALQLTGLQHGCVRRLQNTDVLREREREREKVTVLCV